MTESVTSYPTTVTPEELTAPVIPDEGDVAKLAAMLGMQSHRHFITASEHRLLNSSAGRCLGYGDSLPHGRLLAMVPVAKHPDRLHARYSTVRLPRKVSLTIMSCLPTQRKRT